MSRRTLSSSGPSANPAAGRTRWRSWSGRCQGQSSQQATSLRARRATDSRRAPPPKWRSEKSVIAAVRRPTTGRDLARIATGVQTTHLALAERKTGGWRQMQYASGPRDSDHAWGLSRGTLCAWHRGGLGICFQLELPTPCRQPGKHRSSRL